MLESPKKNEKKIIALACPSFAGGGAERVMVNLANKFIEWGYQVDFLIEVDDGPYRRMLSRQVNKIVLSDTKSGKINAKLQAFFRLRAYLNRTSAKTLMSTVREFNVFTYFSALLSKTKPKIFLREAAALDKSHFKGSPNRWALFFLMRHSYSRANGIISNSYATKHDLISYLGLKENSIFPIYNPLTLDFTPLRHTKSRKTKTIIGVGRLTKNKNFSDLIRTIPLLQDKYGDITLKILGEGKEKLNLENLAYDLGVGSNVQFTGFVDNPYDYYAEADVFVQTSLWEGFGYVLAESMACGTPVVAYDSKGAMREILADGLYGNLTPVGDLEALVAAIVQQIEDPTPPELLRKAVERFDVNVIARCYLEFLDANHD